MFDLKDPFIFISCYDLLVRRRYIECSVFVTATGTEIGKWKINSDKISQLEVRIVYIVSVLHTQILYFSKHPNGGTTVRYEIGTSLNIRVLS